MAKINRAAEVIALLDAVLLGAVSIRMKNKQTTDAIFAVWNKSLEGMDDARYQLILDRIPREVSGAVPSLAQVLALASHAYEER